MMPVHPVPQYFKVKDERSRRLKEPQTTIFNVHSLAFETNIHSGVHMSAGHIFTDSGESL